MKKITAGILTAALVVALGGATVSAVGLGQSAKGSAVQDRTQEQLYKNADGIIRMAAEADLPMDMDMGMAADKSRASSFGMASAMA